MKYITAIGDMIHTKLYVLGYVLGYIAGYINAKLFTVSETVHGKSRVIK